MLASPAKVCPWCCDEDVRYISSPKEAESSVASHSKSQCGTGSNIVLPYSALSRVGWQQLKIGTLVPRYPSREQDGIFFSIVLQEGYYAP